jgi:hypothetical protein
MSTILSLCDYSGVWSAPYERAGYEVIRYDLQLNADVRLLHAMDRPIHGILAAPPCTHFASSGARWWSGKGNAALLEGLSIVDACLRQVAICSPAWWALENPVGRLAFHLGPPALWFNPCDYGDPWTKKTGLWGKFTAPARSPVEPVNGSMMHRMSSAWKNQRSQTPAGFAKAFMEANP